MSDSFGEERGKRTGQYSMVLYFTYCTLLYSYVPCSFPAHTSPWVFFFGSYWKKIWYIGISMSVHNKRRPLRRNFQKVTEAIAGNIYYGILCSLHRPCERRLPARLNPNEPSAPSTLLLVCWCWRILASIKINSPSTLTTQLWPFNKRYSCFGSNSCTMVG